MSMAGPSLYDILEIGTNSSFKDIRKAYLKKVVSEHPDKGGTTSSFEILQNAYKTLSNPEERIIYDERLLGQRVAEEAQRENPAQYYPSTYHTAEGVTVEFHGQRQSTVTDRGFQRKGEWHVGQGQDERLTTLNRDIEKKQSSLSEDPTNTSCLCELAIAYLDRAVYHLHQGKQNHAIFDVYEAEHLYPDIFSMDIPSVQQVKHVKDANIVDGNNNISFDSCCETSSSDDDFHNIE